VTYDTIIDFENPDEKLLPGETAYVTIPTGHAENALGVPNAAMTFVPPLPPNELNAIYGQHRIPVTSYASHVNGHQVVWRHSKDDQIEPIDIRVGISDYKVSQLLEGDVKEGDQLVTGTAVAGGTASSGRGPLPGRGPARR
jgi:HlyD family secretion protein